MAERTLTPTSYVLLALLGLQPWSAYEMAEQMKRGMQYVWPRAERAFYYEAKRLAELGLAEVAETQVGDRRRAVYIITAEGRAALSDWLSDRQPSATRIESEALARLFFAEYGRIEDVRALVAALRADAFEALDVVAARCRHYLGGGNEFPQRLHLIALAGRFIADYGLMLLRYADWVEDQTGAWTGTSPEGKQEQTVATLLAVLADVEAAHSSRAGGSGEGRSGEGAPHGAGSGGGASAAPQVPAG